MKHALAIIVLCACGGSAEVATAVKSPTSGSATDIDDKYSCFHVDSQPVRGMCARTRDECEIGRRAVIKALATELGRNEVPEATECRPRDRAYCAFVAPADGPTYNACAVEATTCSWLKQNLDRAGGVQTGECLDFPSSRLNLPAVEPIQFRMWCFRDQTTAAGSDCQPTQHACEAKVAGLEREGYVKPRAWQDGGLCAAHEKVVCYPQLQRAQQQVKFICTPSFEECQARRIRADGPDFQVLGACAVVTGTTPW